MSSNKKGDDPLANHVSGQSNKPMSAPAHALTADKVVEDLSANADSGLTAEEAKKRLQEFGNNEFGDSEGVQPIKIFIGQLANALTLVRQCFSTSFLLLDNAMRHGRLLSLLELEVVPSPSSLLLFCWEYDCMGI